MARENILVVDDEINILTSVRSILEDEGYQVRTAKSAEEAIEVVKKNPPDLMLLDIWLPKMDGLEALKTIREISPNLGVIMISGHANIDTAVKATKLGAVSFIEKPLSMHRLLIEVDQALKQIALEQENKELKKVIAKHQRMIGHSKSIEEIRSIISTAGPTNGRVLISGESGTGKELVAREIHRSSLRADHPFVEVNCAAIPEDLIESELFGHEKGAFTNATYQKKGKFELADGGTIFLDEIGDMSLKTQAKVLRVLEEGRIERVGGQKSIPVDVRVIAASNKNLLIEIKENKFREDLYFRLNVIPIHLPALREHKDDIPLLADHYLHFFCSEYGKQPKKISDDAMKLLISYPWPGNIRELKNEIERLVIMVPHQTITGKNLREDLRTMQAAALLREDEKDLSDHMQAEMDLKEARDTFEKKLIIHRLQLYHWNVTQTAESLGIERSNLHRKIKQLGIQNPPPASNRKVNNQENSQ